MLRQLYIRNFTLIDELKIEFHPGFSVITGETGAGKSIILGAISMLLGNRADSRQIKNGETKCTIEAHFDLSNYHLLPFFNENDIDYDETDCIIRRELMASGKSRAFINDTPVALSTMKKLGEQIVDIHSQHQNLLLQKEDFQLKVVDIIAEDQQLIDDYKGSYESYKQADEELEELKRQIEKSKEDEDFLRFQYTEIDQARLEDGIQEELEERNKVLAHYEEIKNTLNEADQYLNDDELGVVTRLKSTVSDLRNIEDVFPKIKELSERIDSSYIEIKDIAQEIRIELEHIDFNPSELDEISSKLDVIYSLEHKFHVNTIKELLSIKNSTGMQLHHIDNSDEEIENKKQELKILKTICEDKAASISAYRKKAAIKVETEMKRRLVALGIPNVRFSIEISPKPLSKDGSDKVVFLFSANKSTDLQPISQVASGGEIARVMLSLKAMISGTVKLPTIIFDEIDTGVSGKVAEQMAAIMQEMGNEGRQVISITHLPQIAAYGSTHYKVSKEETAKGTISRMQILTTEERVKEIAQMLSGSSISEAAVNNAKVLLNMKS